MTTKGREKDGPGDRGLGFRQIKQHLGAKTDEEFIQK